MVYFYSTKIQVTENMEIFSDGCVECKKRVKSIDGYEKLRECVRETVLDSIREERPDFSITKEDICILSVSRL